jgi:triosephosphate isomerase
VSILCLGETIEERKKGKEFTRIQSQLSDGLTNVSNKEAKKLIIAYEPVWAIGTGEMPLQRLLKKCTHLFETFSKKSLAQKEQVQ